MLNLAPSVLLVPVMPLGGTPLGESTNLSRSREVTNHRALKCTVKGQDNPLPGAVSTPGLDEAQCTVLQGGQHIETFIGVHESTHAQSLRCGPTTNLAESQMQKPQPNILPGLKAHGREEGRAMGVERQPLQAEHRRGPRRDRGNEGMEGRE